MNLFMDREVCTRVERPGKITLNLSSRLLG